MALMTPQPIANVITPSFTTPAASDTIAATSGLVLYVKNGATTSVVTVVVPGDQAYSGVAATDLVLGTFANGERVFYLPPSIADPATGLITVTYSPPTTVTTALFKI